MMDFYLTEIKANNREGVKVHFPLNPESVTLTTGAITQDYNVMGLGEIRLPRGNQLNVVSWEGKLPGAARSKMSFVKDWKDPAELFSILKKFKESGTVLRLLITETPINMDVFIEQFEPKWSGGFGDMDYSITLTEYKELKIYTVDAPQKSSSTTASRPSKPAPKTYTVKKGDSLWKIAQRFLGKGSRYPEIVAANPGKIRNPHWIYPGQVFVIP